MQKKLLLRGHRRAASSLALTLALVAAACGDTPTVPPLGPGAQFSQHGPAGADPLAAFAASTIWPVKRFSSRLRGRFGRSPCSIDRLVRWATHDHRAWMIPGGRPFRSRVGGVYLMDRRHFRAAPVPDWWSGAL
jgi:hypothetical protein